MLEENHDLEKIIEDAKEYRWYSIPKVVSRILRGSAGHVIDFNDVKDKRVLGF